MCTLTLTSSHKAMNGDCEAGCEVTGVVTYELVTCADPCWVPLPVIAQRVVAAGARPSFVCVIRYITRAAHAGESEAVGAGAGSQDFRDNGDSPALRVSYLPFVETILTDETSVDMKSVSDIALAESGAAQRGGMAKQIESQCGSESSGAAAVVAQAAEGKMLWAWLEGGARGSLSVLVCASSGLVDSVAVEAKEAAEAEGTVTQLMSSVNGGDNTAGLVGTVPTSNVASKEGEGRAFRAISQTLDGTARPDRVTLADGDDGLEGVSLLPGLSTEAHRSNDSVLTDYSRLATTTHHSLLTTHYSPLTTHYSLLTTHHSPLTTHHSPLTTHHSPLTTHHSPLATYHSPITTHHHAPIVRHLQFAAGMSKLQTF